MSLYDDVDREALHDWLNEREALAADERPDPSECEDRDDEPCSICSGEGLCWDGSDPLGDCPDDIHNCHACGGSGNARDQVFF